MEKNSKYFKPDLKKTQDDSVNANEKKPKGYDVRNDKGELVMGVKTEKLAPGEIEGFPPEIQ